MSSQAGSPAWQSILLAIGEALGNRYLMSRAGYGPEIAHPFGTRDQLLAVGAHHVRDGQRSDDSAFVGRRPGQPESPERRHSG